MTLIEALGILEQAASFARLTRAEHAKIIEAVNLLKEKIDAEETKRIDGEGTRESTAAGGSD